MTFFLTVVLDCFLFLIHWVLQFIIILCIVRLMLRYQKIMVRF